MSTLLKSCGSNSIASMRHKQLIGEVSEMPASSGNQAVQRGGPSVKFLQAQFDFGAVLFEKLFGFVEAERRTSCLLTGSRERRRLSGVHAPHSCKPPLDTARNCALLSRLGPPVQRLQRTFAGIAQLVEQLICNQQVVGSNPSAGSSLKCFSRSACMKSASTVEREPNRSLQRRVEGQTFCGWQTMAPAAPRTGGAGGEFS